VAGAQRIVEKHEKRSSHLVAGTRMTNYLRKGSPSELQSAADLIASFHEGKGLEFRTDLTNQAQARVACYDI
jgi:hypothetical protein